MINQKDKLQYNLKNVIKYVARNKPYYSKKAF